MPVSLPAVTAVGVGVALVYSGIANKGFLATVQGVVAGVAPAKIEKKDTSLVDPHGASVTQSGPPTGIQDSGGGGSPSANKATGRLIAASYGWTGAEFDALDRLWVRESGWQANIMNSSSGAFGIAQALGHGNAHSEATGVHVIVAQGGGPQVRNVNEYPNRSANAGSAVAQIRWGCDYIKGRYGSPSAAWAHEVANNWY